MGKFSLFLANFWFGKNLTIPLLLVFFSLICNPVSVFSLPTATQVNTDSLEKILPKKSGKNKLQILILLAGEIMESDPEKGLQYAREAAQVARSENQQLMLSDALKLKADALFYLDSLPQSLIVYLQSAETDLNSPRPRQDSILRRYGDVGFVYLEMGWFNKAIEYFQKALKMSEQQKDTSEIATNLSNLGISYKMLGHFDRAIDCFLRTLELDQLTGNNEHMSINYNAIGMVYHAWGKNDKALEFLEMALEHDLKNGDESKISIRLSNLSKIYLSIEKYQDAISLLEKALEIDRRQNQPAKVAIRLQGLGLCYQAMGDYPKALSYFNESLLIYQGINLEYKIAGLKIQIGKLYLETGNIGKAEMAFIEGLELAQKNKLRPEEIDAANSLYSLYKNQRNFGDALRYFELYKSIQDSVFTVESARQINEFEVKYETEKMDKANQLLIKENELRRRRQQTATGVIAALVLLSFTLLWAFVLKRKSLLQSRELFAKESELSALKVKAVEKQNNHLQELLFAEEEIKRLQAKTLEQKNAELTSASMLIANKNEIFERLKKLAEQIKCEITGEMNEKVKEIITEIDRQTDVESQWEQFRTRFESVHKSFFDKLHKNDGALTQNDLQLCAYIKLNLNTKEIARLMNISPESVNTSRYRLRKKLNLPPEVTLDDFVHKL